MVRKIDWIFERREIMRDVIIFIFFATTWISQSFESDLLALLGFIFMPAVMLGHMFLHLSWAETTNYLLVMTVLVCVDIFHWICAIGRHIREES